MSRRFFALYGSMKLFSTVFLSILGLIASPVLAWEAVPQKVVDSVYAFVGDTGPRSAANEGMNTTTGFVVTSDGVVVIDSGSSKLVAQKIASAIRHITPLPIRYVINTGGQDHRWLGNSHFAEQNIPIIASTVTKADIADRGGMWAASMERIIGTAFAGTRVQLPTQTFSRRTTLTLGGETIELMHAGGHSPGDTIVWLPHRRVAFTGDLVFLDRLLGVLPVSKVKDWLVSFDTLAALQPQWIVPGHGAPATLDKARRETRDYLALVYRHMQKAVAVGQDMQEAIRTLEDSAFASLPIYPEVRGQNANRVYLEVEAE